MNLDNPKIRELITLASDNGHTVKIRPNHALINFGSDFDYVCFFDVFGDICIIKYFDNDIGKNGGKLTEDEFRGLISEKVLPGARNVCN